MVNIALIFAGGTGQRMNTRTVPKQFLELHGKPIIVYTIEQFQHHPLINGIVVVMLEDWIERFRNFARRYCLDKVLSVVAGGDNGQASIYNGLKEVSELCPPNSTVLIHDGVRPLISDKTITLAIECVKAHGSAVTVSPAIETVTLEDGLGRISTILERSNCKLAKAPQCFVLENILSAHEKAIADGKNNFIDSASLMQYYGYDLYTVEGLPENIKITTPSDFYIFRAFVDVKENSQIFGYEF